MRPRRPPLPARQSDPLSDLILHSRLELKQRKAPAVSAQCRDLDMGCYVISKTMACQVLIESICALMSTPFCGCGPTAGRCIFSKHRLPLAHIQYRGFWDSVLKDSRVLSIYFDPMALPELLCCTSLSLDVRRFHVQQFRAVMWSGVFHAFLDARAMR